MNKPTFDNHAAVGIYMKNILILAGLLVALSTSSCEKTDCCDPNPNNILGNWNLINISGGFGGGGYKAKFDAIKFTNDKYELHKDKTVLLRASYGFNTKGDSLILKDVPTVDEPFTNIQSKKIEILHGDTLILTESCCDLYQYRFVKVKN